MSHLHRKWCAQKKILCQDDNCPVNVASVSVHLAQDSSSVDEIKRAIANELAKEKPRDLVLAPLMKSTFEERRMHILSEPASVDDFLKGYPALSRPAMVCLNFCAINAF